MKPFYMPIPKIEFVQYFEENWFEGGKQIINLSIIDQIYAWGVL